MTIVCFFRFRSLFVDDLCLQLASDNGSSAPILAIAYEDAQSSSTVESTGPSVVLYIQPTGFHLFHEIVATFILFEQFCGKTRVDHPCKETRVASGIRRGQIVYDNFCDENFSTDPQELRVVSFLENLVSSRRAVGSECIVTQRTND